MSRSSWPGLGPAATRRRGVARDGVPMPRASVGLGMSAALDAMIAAPIPLLSSLGSPDHYAAASAELDAAVAYYRDAGWLEDPGRRHRRPDAAADMRMTPGPVRPPGVEAVWFDSGWRPEAGEPGGGRWLSLRANQRVPVRLLRHPGGPRPWLIAVHGQSMGRPGDVKMLRVRRLHKALGINVALPVLPLHGPRAEGMSPPRQFASNVFATNNVLGLTQAVWDIRRLLGWLRDAQQAPAVGVLGVSLGAYVISLLSTLEGELDSLIAVVPTSDLDASMREAAPITRAKRRWHRLVHDDRSALVHRVVSPLAAPCLVPHQRRHIVAGQVDRIAPPQGAAQLWQHWGEPEIAWRPCGHVTTWRGADYDDHITSVLDSDGLRHRS